MGDGLLEVAAGDLCGEVGTSLGFHLGVDVGQVFLDRVDGHEQALTDAGVAVPFGDQPHDVAFDGSQGLPAHLVALPLAPPAACIGGCVGQQQFTASVPAGGGGGGAGRCLSGVSHTIEALRPQPEPDDARLGVESLRCGEQAKWPFRLTEANGEVSDRLQRRGGTDSVAVVVENLQAVVGQLPRLVEVPVLPGQFREAEH